jgi:hypothetical protein
MNSLNFAASFTPRIEQAASQINASGDFPLPFPMLGHPITGPHTLIHVLSKVIRGSQRLSPFRQRRFKYGSQKKAPLLMAGQVVLGQT